MRLKIGCEISLRIGFLASENIVAFQLQKTNLTIIIFFAPGP